MAAAIGRRKEQCLWTRLYEQVDDVRLAVATFVETYKTRLIPPHGRQTPRAVPRPLTTEGGSHPVT